MVFKNKLQKLFKSSNSGGKSKTETMSETKKDVHSSTRAKISEDKNNFFANLCRPTSEIRENQFNFSRSDRNYQSVNVTSNSSTSSSTETFQETTKTTSWTQYKSGGSTYAKTLSHSCEIIKSTSGSSSHIPIKVIHSDIFPMAENSYAGLRKTSLNESGIYINCTPSTNPKVGETPSYTSAYPNFRKKSEVSDARLVGNSLPNISNFSVPNKTSHIPVKAPSNPRLQKLKPGILRIFNQEDFKETKLYRAGSGHDVKKLKETFGDLFKLDVDVYNSLKVSEIRQKVQQLKIFDFSNYSCLVIAILSHGQRHEKIFAKDGNISIDDDILFPLLDNTTLKGKPKIFLIQACKGDKEVYVTDSPRSKTSPNDIIKFYGTFEGYVAYRSPERGSEFIQQFCRLLEQYGKTTQIQTIINMVIDAVKRETNNRQTPSVTSNLTKPFILGEYL